ncbi:MAG: GNAT family N-acetyltransferase [Pseudomonadota bacterium]
MKSETPEIVQVGLEFEQALSALWTTTFQEAYTDTHTTENIAAYCKTNFSVTAAREALSNPETICKIAGPIGEPRGFYLLKMQACPEPTDGRGCELKQIYLREVAYGTGLGRRLFDDAIICARGLRADYVWLSVSALNTRAQKFYQKLGFETVGDGPVFEVGSDRLASNLMVRPLR